MSDAKPLGNKCLVLVHGFLGASNNWLGVVSKLKAHTSLKEWDVFCADLRWHSADPDRFVAPPEGPPSTMLVAKTLAADLGKLPATELVVVGHSFGLRPLLKILAQDLVPDKQILLLVAEDSTPELSGHGTQMLEKILSQTPVPFVSREAARQFFDESYGASSALSRFLLSNIREDETRGGHTWRFSEHLLLQLLRSSVAESLQNEWCEIKTPVHMIVGKHSEHLTPELARHWQKMRVEKSLPTELTFIEGAGHWVHAEQPDHFVQALVNEVVKVSKVINLA
jgi:esterase